MKKVTSFCNNENWSADSVFLFLSVSVFSISILSLSLSLSSISIIGNNNPDVGLLSEEKEVLLGTSFFCDGLIVGGGVWCGGV